MKKNEVGVRIRLKNIFGTYLCSQSTLVLELHPYIFKLSGRSFYISLHRSVGRSVGWSVGRSVCQKNVKNCQKEVSRLLMTVQFYSKIMIACLSVRLYTTGIKQALLSLEAAIKSGIFTNTAGALDHTYTELSVASATLVLTDRTTKKGNRRSSAPWSELNSASFILFQG